MDQVALSQVVSQISSDPLVAISTELLRQGPLGIILAWFMLRLERKLEDQRQTDERLSESLAELTKAVALHSELLRHALGERRDRSA